MTKTLLIGPPGTGKTHRALAELAAAGAAAILIVPTASMAEHLLHESARGCSSLSPSAIQPLDRFVESFTPECRELSPATEALLLRRAAQEFAGVARFPGFQASLLETIREFWAAGAEDTSNTPFARAMAKFESLLQKAGAVRREQRLRLAAERIAKQKPGSVILDGFFSFTAGEIDLVRALAAAADRLLVTLPDAGAGDARLALAEIGVTETALSQVHRPRVPPRVIRAPSPEREIEDIAGRIVRDHQATGRPFREYGLIVRTPQVYHAIIAVVFERFGIPFRRRHPMTLDAHGAVRYLAGLLRLIAGGFDGVAAVEILQHAASGLAGDPETDRFDFLVREEPPGQGLEFLRACAKALPRVQQWLSRLDSLAPWAAAQVAPSMWAERSCALQEKWFHLPTVPDGISHTAAFEWRELAQALRGWRETAAETAEALESPGSEKIGLADFLDALEVALRLTSLRTPDRRRDVVQVLSVYEARQWELPVVFVCGLVEKQFPQHHAQNLFFPDGARRGLAMKGIRLRTSEDLDREERELFDLALTRATAQLYLTYPAHDEEGSENLRSFFLDGLDGDTADAERVRVRESPPDWRPAQPALHDPALIAAVGERHARFSPSALEKYAQCPFQFFADRTLRLAGPPPSPEERIDELLKGTIVHRVIARWSARGGEIGPVFEEVFEEVCAYEGIRLNFRAEAFRMELLADLQRFAAFERERLKPAGFEAGPPESEVEYVLEEGLDRPVRITGRIDRYEVSSGRAAIVIDYKYSRGDRIKRLIQEHEEGIRLQAPLYLAGLERQLGLIPAGMLLYGLRKEPSRRGWAAAGVIPPDPDLELKSPEEFRAMLDHACARTVEIVAEIRSGRTDVKPRDRQVCRQYCRYLEVCRVNPWG